MSFGDVAMISMEPNDPVPALSTAAWLGDIDDDLVDTLVRHVLEPTEPSAVLVAEVRHAGGAVSVVDPSAAAYGNREAQHVLQLVGILPTPEVAMAFKLQVAAIKRDIEPHMTGHVYINFLELDEKRQRTRQAFSDEAWPRLLAIKAEVDPDNLFRHGFDLSPELG